MKPDLQKYAPIGLYLALAAALTSFALYIIQREWNLYLQISLGVMVIGLAIYAILNPESVRQALTGRQARYGSNALVLSLAFLGILVVVNYFIFQNSKQWDLTEDQRNTLAPETIDTLKNLPENVEALAFYTVNISSEQAQNLLERYKFESGGKFDYRIIDPDADPITAREAQITRDGMIVLRMAGRQEPVDFVSEQELTGGLVRLISGESSAVYFLTGHGEASPEASGDESYSQAKQVLETKNYTVKMLNLLADNRIPEDANVIVIAGPTKPVTDGEVDLLRTFVEGGGALIVMENPVLFTEFGDAPDPLGAYLQEAWSIQLGNDVIVDWTSMQPLQVFAAQYASHPITDKLQNLGTAFPTARQVEAGSPPSGVTTTEIIQTASQSWAEMDLPGLEAALQSGQQLNIGADDIPGPVPVAVVGENGASGGRVAVFGDRDFGINANFTYLGNGDLFINTVDWAAQKENLINLTPKNTITRTVVPTQRYTMGLILFGSVFLLPGLVLGSGIVVWYQRRKRG